MCIAITKRSSNPDYAFFVVMNREERNGLAWKPWGYHWNTHLNCYGCLDVATGGSWIAINDSSVLAMLINRESSSESEESRALVVLDALDGARTARDVKTFLTERDLTCYRPFNLIAVDCETVQYYTNQKAPHEDFDDSVLCGDLVMTNRSFPNDFNEARIKNNYDKFLKAGEPNPSTGDYAEWIALLSETCHTDSPETEFTMTLVSDHWRTLSSAIISIPSSRAFPIIQDCEVAL